ncbi:MULTISPECIES: RNA polymerase sigma factor [Roseobacteraceae]|uniref:RNA polymerase sigma factor n=1 Tax=Roseobacteraceae TaxID=2854170 RepID=UPI00080A99EE|nr:MULTISPECIES: RNA polymerase sigma factor [Roseobacteraceae]ANT61194.1 RNA polymerase subunit sigma [Salipiger sp. CCB-MM3]MCA0994433.1 RNA polymerase sigma factor [Alloyangia pacifica]NDV99426.1 RNA polymerase sigma factor [Salipiger sp. PrR002]NDW58698.1 RNA polymerase sigma factor [Salipiger sp. PrR004]
MSSDPRDEIVDHLPALRAFAFSLTRNSALADDMVQDTLVKAWTKINTFEQGTNMRAWLFTILRNTYYSNRRKAGREVSDAEGVFTESLSEKPAHDGRLQMNDFRRAFAKLTDEQREALILVGAQGFAYEEAAETCGVAVGTIKSRVNRARARLAELLELDEHDRLELTDQATMAVVSGARPSGALG